MANVKREGDLARRVITVKLPASLGYRLDTHVDRGGDTISELVINALNNALPLYGRDRLQPVGAKVKAASVKSTPDW